MKSRYDNTLEPIRNWLATFSRAVRERDFDGGRELFSPNVAAFGTRANSVHGLDTLVDTQWSPIWNNTRDFKYHLESLDGAIHGSTAWAAVTWHSNGVRPDGSTFDRYGRATFVMECVNGRWLAVHSHHSLSPDLSQTTPSTPATPRAPRDSARGAH